MAVLVACVCLRMSLHMYNYKNNCGRCVHTPLCFSYIFENLDVLPSIVIIHPFSFYSHTYLHVYLYVFIYLWLHITMYCYLQCFISLCQPIFLLVFLLITLVKYNKISLPVGPRKFTFLFQIAFMCLLFFIFRSVLYPFISLSSFILHLFKSRHHSFIKPFWIAFILYIIHEKTL
uniref:Uncharacterized protein n=1 Tax=Octopus bimaculoides TaxID=37653 RepID=A0A0L8FSE4_OCTBM